MDCNKEDAIKAMQLAERKMQVNDFTGARKMAQKAQQLFPGIENIAQLLAVCEVHCSAEIKLGGCEMDWYGILQVQRFSHEAIIKKQFRKLKLLLHPDKNKFVGAEAAFKLIGDANAVLADRGKHFRYDMKCRALLRTGVIKSSSHQFNEEFSVRKHCDAARNVPVAQYASMNERQKGQAETFITCCPFCKTVDDCAKDTANRLFLCQRCRRLFVSSDFGIQGMNSETLRKQFSNHTKLPNQISIKVASIHGGTGNLPVTRVQTGNAASNSVSKVGVSADIDGASNTENQDSGNGVGVPKVVVEMSKSGPMKKKDSGHLRNMNKKRENSVESVGKFKSANRDRPETEHVVIQEKFGSSSELNAGPRLCQSLMKKQNLSYIENLDDDDDDDDDFVNPPKRLRKGHLSSVDKKERKDATLDGDASKNNTSTSSAAAAVSGDKKNTRAKVNIPPEENLPNKKSTFDELKVKEAAMPDNEKSSFKADVSAIANEKDVRYSRGAIEVPSPQFHKFVLGEDMLPSLLKANQTWALYDEVDGMPRFYALIRKVHTPGFKVFINWLFPDPDDKCEIGWVKKKLPVACGKFTLGDTEEITDRLMFSHQMHCNRGSVKDSFLVYPRKGETWALYKNWDIGWSYEPEKHIPYKYEFVEILSDFVRKRGATVACLSKVKGFVSLLERKKQSGEMLSEVPSNELHRFSHRIPSFKMTGKERDGVPKGSFELDPAALPTNLEELS